MSRCIICGSRDINNYSLLLKAISASTWEKDITEVVCGDAYGVDSLGERWAIEHKIPVKHFPAKWNDIGSKGAIIGENQYGKYNKMAGFNRNETMCKYADRLIAVIKDNSSGTTHCIDYMTKLGKPTYVWEV